MTFVYTGFPYQTWTGQSFRIPDHILINTVTEGFAIFPCVVGNFLIFFLQPKDYFRYFDVSNLSKYTKNALPQYFRTTDRLKHNRIAVIYWVNIILQIYILWYLLFSSKIVLSSNVFIFASLKVYWEYFLIAGVFNAV